MALSMDEQRILDAMERKLADDDPLLASRLTSFGRPGVAALMRSRRARIVLSFLALIVIAAVSLAVYALTPFRTSFDPGRSARPTSSTPAREADSTEHRNRQHALTRAGVPAGCHDSRQSWSRYCSSALEPLPGLLEFVAERVGVHLEQGRVTPHGLGPVAGIHVHPVVAHPAGQPEAAHGWIGPAGVDNAQPPAQVQGALRLVLVPVTERGRRVFPLLDRELHADVLLGAGHDHLLPGGADQAAAGGTGPPGASRSTAESWTTEHASLWEDWDLQPKQPAAQRSPSGRRYPCNKAWIMTARSVPGNRP